MFAPKPEIESRAPMWKMIRPTASRTASLIRRALVASLVLLASSVVLSASSGSHGAGVRAWSESARDPAPGTRRLIYRFGAGMEDPPKRPLHYRFTFRGTETIQRPTKPFEKRYDCRLDLSMIGAEIPPHRTIPRDAIDLVTTIETMRLLCFAGRGSYTFELTNDLYRERRPNTSTLKFNLDDIYRGSSTVRSIRDSPGNLRTNNGVLLDPPDPPVLLSLTDCDYLFDLLPMMMPPLPRAAIEPGRTWKAGLPMRFSVYSEARPVRFRVTYESFDEGSGRAVVNWAAQLEQASLTPTPGIHHIREDACATGPFKGRLVLDPDGRIISSELTMTGTITHPHSQSSPVDYDFTMRLELKGDEDSMADARKSTADDKP